MCDAKAGSLTASVLAHTDGATVTLNGKLDALSAPILEGVILGLTNSGMNDIVLDLEHLWFMDSFGLGSIIHAARTLPATIQIVNSSARVRRLLDLTRAGSLVSVT